MFVLPYEYIDDSKEFNETSLFETKEFFSNLRTEYITHADYMHAKGICKDFEMKDLGEYHDLYLKIVTLILADVFKNFRKMFLRIYHFKKHINMLLIVKKALEEQYATQFIDI